MNAVLDSVVRSDEVSLTLSRNITELTSCYTQGLSSRKKLYAISHSQGGLFVNDAFSVVLNEQNKSKVATYQVGSPADRFKDQAVCWSYGKHNRDFATILFGVRPNIQDELVTSDFLSHGMLETYLEPLNASLYRRLKRRTRLSP